MKRSPEIEAVLRRYLRAIEAGDLDTVRAMIDPSEHTVVLGSDPLDRVTGAGAVEFLVASTEHRRDYTYRLTQVDAFESGPVGWVAAEAIADFDPDESRPELVYDPVPLRMTAVLALNQGSWQIVQWHFSTPLPDDPAVSGPELTEAVSELIAALNESSQVSELTARLKTDTVSLVFTDIVDSTQRAAEAGDEAWTAIATGHFDDIERISAANGGVVVKTIGDGAMMAFSSARKAVSAAVGVLGSTSDAANQSPLSLRIGVHVGEAVKTDIDYFGQTVNEAARIMASAEPDQILVSDLVRSLVGDTAGIEFGIPFTLELRGIQNARQVYPVIV